MSGPSCSVAIVPSSPEHAQAFLKWRQQDAARRFNPLVQMDLLALQQRLVAVDHDLANIWTSHAFRWFVLSAGELVGTVALSNVNAQMRTAEIGYMIDSAHQGRGLATAALGLLVARVFGETDTRKLIALVHEANVASCRVLEKLGFQREGLLREHYLIGSEPANEIIFGLLRRDWASAPTGPT